jgi:hypothetical protein
MLITLNFQDTEIKESLILRINSLTKDMEGRIKIKVVNHIMTNTSLKDPWINIGIKKKKNKK